MTSKEVLVGQSAPSAHLVVHGVEKRFGGVHALRGADFEVARGEVMALVGDCLLYTSPSPRDIS